MAEYRNFLTSKVNDQYATVLTEAVQNLMRNKRINALGEGYKDVIFDESAFEAYSDSLTEGFDATDTENLKKLFKNNRFQVIQENSVAGIPPITSLAMPAIARVWAKFGIKNAMPTEVVDKPAFSVAFNNPYIIDNETKEKHYLPDALRDPDTELGECKAISKEAHTLPMKKFDLLAEVGCSHLSGDTLSSRLFITSVTIEADTKTPETKETKVVKLKTALDINRRLYEEISVTASDGTVTEETLLGSVDLEKGTINLVTMNGKAKSVTLKGNVSSESHNRSTETGFEIKRRDFEIAPAEHFEASLPIEMLTDTMALYNIDGASVLTETLSNVISQKLEMELYKFLRDCQEVNATYTGEFDCYPSSNFSINPQEWLENLKRVIDFYANKIKNDSYFYQGYFAILGNPIDTALIPNVNWTFNAANDNINGINVNYSIGAMSGSNKYVVVSSDLIPQGSFIIFMIPTVANYLTYKYYPYTFNVVNNYLNAQGKKTPNIMMTKRQTVEEFMPLIAKIKIIHNNGVIDYQAPVAPVSKDQ